MAPSRKPPSHSMTTLVQTPTSAGRARYDGVPGSNPNTRLKGDRRLEGRGVSPEFTGQPAQWNHVREHISKIKVETDERRQPLRSRTHTNMSVFWF